MPGLRRACGPVMRATRCRVGAAADVGARTRPGGRRRLCAVTVGRYHVAVAPGTCCRHPGTLRLPTTGPFARLERRAFRSGLLRHQLERAASHLEAAGATRNVGQSSGAAERASPRDTRRPAVQAAVAAARRHRSEPLDRATITPAMHRAPPTIASAAGTSPRRRTLRTIAIGGTR